MTITVNTHIEDEVAVIDADGNQVFSLARPVKATVKEESKVMEHPVEDGSTITDHRVLLPVEIELALVLSSEEYRDVYQEIRELWANADLLTVQTRTGNYGNMIIYAMPHDETTDMTSGVAIGLKLKEVRLVEANIGKLPAEAVQSSKNTSKTDRGQQAAQADKAPEKKKSLLKEWLG